MASFISVAWREAVVALLTLYLQVLMLSFNWAVVVHPVLLLLLRVLRVLVWRF